MDMGIVSVARGRDAEHTPEFSFPVLKAQDILKCMEEAGIALTEDELKEPNRHRDRLKEMWADVLYFLTGQSEEDLNIPILPEDADEETKLMLGAAGDTLLFRALNQLLNTAGYKNFSMRDLYAPKTKTLRYQLSAVLNMMMYREDQLRFYEELSEPRQELIEALKEAQEEHRQFNERLNQAQVASQQKNAELEEIIKECHELELEIARDNRRQATTREEAAKLQREANNLKDEITAAEWKLEEVESQEENLRAKIVSSPDRRRTETQQLKDRVLAEKKANVMLEEDFKKGKGILLNLQKVDRELKTTTAQSAELLELANKYMNLIKSVQENESKMDEKDKEIKDLEQEIEEEERRVNRAEEKIVSQRKQHSLEFQATQEAQDKAKSRLLVVEKETRGDMLRTQQAEEQEKLLKNKLESEVQRGNKELEAMVNEYKKAEAAFLERDAKRLGAVGFAVS